uniref:hypothetical protein n=1 Tax=Trichocoleus desertorum TaxID=1481672 RepID=UPI0025B435BE|nr:hypothetical protein [Trichocoleus desertorum]
MPFASTTRDRVMGALELPVTVYYVQRVQDALNHAEVHGGEDAVSRIEGYLDKYETQESALDQGADQAGLIKADVLEWSVGGKTQGYKAAIARLRKQIAKALLLDSLVRGNGVRLIR